MATASKKITPYRPDATETILLAKLAKKRGLSLTRLIGTAIREMAERDGVKVTEEDAIEAEKSLHNP